MPEKLCLAHSDQSNLLLKVLILMKVKPMNDRSHILNWLLLCYCVCCYVVICFFLHHVYFSRLEHSVLFPQRPIAFSEVEKKILSD